ncbi:hypothetical protein CASFOL_001334 [Castilleja foliolosa]|uniref:Uncharacterized protein n=1 Tax=Castilleja foliolosa TaxID=1961234 RepID=A0ABD3EMI8_9LAMI
MGGSLKCPFSCEDKISGVVIVNQCRPRGLITSYLKFSHQVVNKIFTRTLRVTPPPKLILSETLPGKYGLLPTTPSSSKTFNPSLIKTWVLAFRKQEANGDGNEHSSSTVGWERPPKPKFKFNFDGCHGQHNDVSGAGGLLRNWKGTHEEGQERDGGATD